MSYLDEKTEFLEVALPVEDHAMDKYDIALEAAALATINTAPETSKSAWMLGSAIVFMMLCLEVLAFNLLLNIPILSGICLFLESAVFVRAVTLGADCMTLLLNNLASHSRKVNINTLLRSILALLCILFTLLLSNYRSLKQANLEWDLRRGPVKDVQVPDYFFTTWQTKVKEACITHYEREEKHHETWLNDMLASCMTAHQDHPDGLLSKWCTNKFESTPFPPAHYKPVPTSFAAWCIAAFEPSNASNTTSGDNMAVSSEAPDDYEVRCSDF